MSAHLHGTFVKGCYRCDLSRDEMTAQITAEAEEERRLRARMGDLVSRIDFSTSGTFVEIKRDGVLLAQGWLHPAPPSQAPMSAAREWLACKIERYAELFDRNGEWRDGMEEAAALVRSSDAS